MAANMIGVNRAAIIVNMGFNNIVMFNPKLLSCSGEYETEEGCLSLSGVRKTKRYRDRIYRHELAKEKDQALWLLCADSAA